MTVAVVDGHGGRMGAQLVEGLKHALPGADIAAVGTNSIATAAMMRAGATRGATGENPVVVTCREADFIVGPIGIIAADALMGEITPAMAVAVGQSRAQKVLLPVNRCSLHVAGLADKPLSALVQQAVQAVLRLAAEPSGA